MKLAAFVAILLQFCCCFNAADFEIFDAPALSMAFSRFEGSVTIEPSTEPTVLPTFSPTEEPSASPTTDLQSVTFARRLLQNQSPRARPSSKSKPLSKSKPSSKSKPLSADMGKINRFALLHITRQKQSTKMSLKMIMGKGPAGTCSSKEDGYFRHESTREEHQSNVDERSVVR